MRIERSKQFKKDEAFAVIAKGIPRNFGPLNLWEYEYIRLENGFYETVGCNYSEKSTVTRVYAERYLLMPYYQSLYDQLGVTQQEVNSQAKILLAKKIEIAPKKLDAVKAEIMKKVVDKNQEQDIENLLKGKEITNEIRLRCDVKTLGHFFKEGYEEESCFTGIKEEFAEWISLNFLVTRGPIKVKTIYDELCGKSAPKRSTQLLMWPK